MRITHKRQQILDVLKRYKKPLTAQNVHKKLPSIDLVTIYRNLDLFATEGIITRVHLNENEVHYEYQSHPHYHAICRQCKRIIPFPASDKKVKQLISIKDFDADEIEIIVHGTCSHK